MNRRLLSFTLAALLCLQPLCMGAFAATECEHHLEHTADCGYAWGTEEIPCGHDHLTECYPEGDSTAEPTSCIHTEHTDDCGYTPAAGGMPCSFACAECAAAQPDPIAAVQALIDGLPGAEGITDENADDVGALLTAVDDAMTAYGFGDEEKGQLDPTRYYEAVTALENLAGIGGAGEPDFLVVGDSFEDAASGLKFKVLTENGSTGVVAVVANSYTDSSYTIPREITYNGIVYTVTEIDRYAFSKCENLTSIAIPDSVTTIGTLAFEKCTSLESITIPYSVRTIGSNIFYFCSKLKSVTIPNSVIEMGMGVFEGCAALTNVTFPGGQTSIPSYTFLGCTSLKSITIPGSVIKIGEQAFGRCTSLESITIPDSVVDISVSAFSECTSLKSLTIPGSVTTMGGPAFYGCTNLELKIMVDKKEGVDLPFSISDDVKSVTYQYATPGNPRWEDTTATWDKLGIAYVRYEVQFSGTGSHGQEWATTSFYTTENSMDLSEYSTAPGVYSFTVKAVEPEVVFNHITIQESASVQSPKLTVSMPELTDVQAVRTASDGVTLSFHSSVPGELYYLATTLESINGPGTDGTGIACTQGGNTVTLTGISGEEMYLELRLKDNNGMLSNLVRLKLPNVSDTVKVTYDANGGTGTIPVDNNLYVAGDKVIYADPTDLTGPDNKVFAYWDTSPEGNTNIWYPGEATITQNMYLYAIWRNPQISVTYSANGENVSVPTDSSQYDMEADIMVKAPVETLTSDSEKIFIGWNTQGDGSGITYQAGDRFKVYQLEDVTLYAMWAEAVTVTYDANGGTGTPPEPDIVAKGSKIVFPFPDDLKAPDGKVFKWWGSAPNGGNNLYGTVNENTVYDDMVLYAVWEDAPNPTSHSITVTTEGSGTASASEAAAVKGTVITLTATPASGWHFQEWTVVAGDVTISGGSFIMPDQAVTIQAEFIQDEPEPESEPTRARVVDSDSPQTGDTTHTALWLALAAIGLLGLTVSILVKRYLRKRG